MIAAQMKILMSVRDLFYFYQEISSRGETLGGVMNHPWNSYFCFASGNVCVKNCNSKNVQHLIYTSD